MGTGKMLSHCTNNQKMNNSAKPEVPQTKISKYLSKKKNKNVGFSCSVCGVPEGNLAESWTVSNSQYSFFGPVLIFPNNAGNHHLVQKGPVLKFRSSLKYGESNRKCATSLF